ncbi:hypothetical protein SAMN06295974_3806 [Plantibacter flavus]|uniref:Uncharacterized protein n=1 Tax=Plantibacter flavus TaxID=150123 RepID=A0A3N2BL90_9MICO|nr:hypothetical protein [Plantibacter flavus]ROR76047.1 hypothetical protein EDD42_4000 [Plantibacter flavus]SMG49005.1 hypothetical protein SAMN06295974_3806 [Plantibacter flavus]
MTTAENAPDVTPESVPKKEFTVAVFADPRAATHLLQETIAKLIDTRGIELGLIDLSSTAGRCVAQAFKDAGVPYKSLEFGQEYPVDESMVDGVPAVDVVAVSSTWGHAFSRGQHLTTIDELGAIDANVVLIPAMVDIDETHLDFTHGSLMGVVYTQLEEARRPVLIIDTPERGLRMGPDGAYLRAIVHVSGAS